MRSVHWVFLWRAALGHVGSAYRHTMIGGLFGVVKGGFWGICRRTQEGGIPAYAGMTGGMWDRTGGGVGYDGRAGYVVGRRRGDSCLRGNDGRRAGRT